MNFAKTGNVPSPRAAVNLSKLKDFGSNPGHLRAKVHIPEGLEPGAALVVALHGSQQSAHDYANGAGWSHYANQHGFALLLPEQRRSNNPLLSFNWFRQRDNRRAGGESESIRQMIETLVRRHGLDAKSVFITGLSSGGAMSIVMMATYPEIFAGGAVIAGLPYGCADGVMQAVDRMHGLGGPTAASMEATIRGASSHTAAWPTLSLWHGSADRTVSVGNVESILGQWSGLHGLPPEPTRQDIVEGYPRRVWCDAEGRELVEVYSITGMGHGTPIETIEEDGAGVAGDFMLDVHISSTRHIARFWGLAPLTLRSRAPAVDATISGSRSDLGATIEPKWAVPRGAGEAGKRAHAGNPEVGSGTEKPALQASNDRISPFFEALQVQFDFTARMMAAAATPWWAPSVNSQSGQASKASSPSAD